MATLNMVEAYQRLSGILNDVKYGNTSVKNASKEIHNLHLDAKEAGLFINLEIPEEQLKAIYKSEEDPVEYQSSGSC